MLSGSGKVRQSLRKRGGGANLSGVGPGWLDESEVDENASAKRGMESE